MNLALRPLPEVVCVLGRDGGGTVSQRIGGKLPTVVDES